MIFSPVTGAQIFSEFFNTVVKGTGGLLAGGFGGPRSALNSTTKAWSDIGSRMDGQWDETIDLFREDMDKITNNKNLTDWQKDGLKVARTIDHGVAMLSDGIGSIFGGVAAGVANTTGAILGTTLNMTAKAGYLGAKHVGLPAAQFVGGLALAGAKVGGGVALGAGKVLGEVGVRAGAQVGDYAWTLAKGVYHTRNSRSVQLATGALGLSVIAPAAAEYGGAKAELAMKSANRTMGSGGTFLREQSRPVDSFGASGDLVFALHNLRNGG